jgi:hypothetical protein
MRTADEVMTMGRVGKQEQLEAIDGTRDIPKWTRRYAENRTLPVAVSLVIFVVGYAAIAGLSYLAAWCLHSRAYPAAFASLVVLLGVLIFWVWFSFRGASRIVPRVSAYLYRGEGSVSLGGPEAACPAGRLGAIVLGVGIALHVCLSVLGFLPLEYMQPISALYLVPALLLMRMSAGKPSRGSPFLLLWPALYALHAGMVVAGLPIQFTGSLMGLNMLIPVAGYGLIAALAGHLYSRIALRRLKSLADASALATGEGPKDGEEG